MHGVIPEVDVATCDLHDFDQRPRLPAPPDAAIDFSDWRIGSAAHGGAGYDERRRAPLFHVKICGVTTAEDARMVAAAGADAIGLNFVPGSPRRLELPQARSVAAAVPAGVLRVGVFAGATPAEMLAIAGELALDCIQLHGHLEGGSSADTGPVDPPERCRDLAGHAVIRAVRLDDARPPEERLDAARRWIAAARAAGAGPRMVIIDAAVPRGTAAGQLGGTGATVDWEAVARAGTVGVPLALAGGLGPENVAAAIRASGCRAVDTASGVERAPGRKDPAKVGLFVAAARAALGLPEV